MTKPDRIAQLVTIRHLVEGLIRAEAGEEQDETPCCARPAPKNFGTFAGDDWRCENCGTKLAKDTEANAG